LYALQVFDMSGSFVLSFGSNGEGNGQFNAPTGVAVDANDNILVADWGNSRLAVFDASGSFVAFVNTAACPLYGPQGLAVTPDGNVVVADSGNHCFKIYR
jgi:tripartite motif-containing protein 2/3